MANLPARFWRILSYIEIPEIVEVKVSHGRNALFPEATTIRFSVYPEKAESRHVESHFSRFIDNDFAEHLIRRMLWEILNEYKDPR